MPNHDDSDSLSDSLNDSFRDSFHNSFHVSGARRALLPGIQALRGLAALLVVFHHYVGTSVERGFAIPGLERAAIGNAGVDIFFIISGFIMEYTLARHALQPGDRGRFLLRRAARILPLYWTLTLVAALITVAVPWAVNSSTTPSLLMYSMLLVPDGAVGAYVLPLAWTLTYEVIFYLVFALLMGLPPLVRLALLLAACTPSLFAGPDVGAAHPLLGMLGNPILFEFAAGVALAQLLAHGIVLRWQASLLLVIAAGLMLVLQLNNNVTDPLLRLLYWGLPALFLAGAVALSPPHPVEPRRPALPARLGSWLGELSYSLYLSHFFGIALFAKLYFHTLINMAVPPWLSALGLFATCLAMAQLCYQFIEKPARDWLRQALFRRQRPLRTA